MNYDYTCSLATTVKINVSDMEYVGPSTSDDFPPDHEGFMLFQVRYSELDISPRGDYLVMEKDVRFLPEDLGEVELEAAQRIRSSEFVVNDRPGGLGDRFDFGFKTHATREKTDKNATTYAMCNVWIKDNRLTVTVGPELAHALPKDTSIEIPIYEIWSKQKNALNVNTLKLMTPR